MANSIKKGKPGEREVISILQAHGYTDACSGQQYSGANVGPDVVGIPGLRMDVYKRERLNIHKALTKCGKVNLYNDIPVVIHRRNGEKWAVSMGIEDFLILWKWEELNDWTDAELLAELKRRKA